jgi:hypothetical protein
MAPRGLFLHPLKAAYHPGSVPSLMGFVLQDFSAASQGAAALIGLGYAKNALP